MVTLYNLELIFYFFFHLELYPIWTEKFDTSRTPSALFYYIGLWLHPSVNSRKKQFVIRIKMEVTQSTRMETNLGKSLQFLSLFYYFHQVKISTPITRYKSRKAKIAKIIMNDMIWSMRIKQLKYVRIKAFSIKWGSSFLVSFSSHFSTSTT